MLGEAEAIVLAIEVKANCLLINERLERKRQKILNEVQQWLEIGSKKYGIEQAYIFGSLTHPNRFTKQFNEANSPQIYN